jgi:hypothetical protein
MRALKLLNRRQVGARRGRVGSAMSAAMRRTTSLFGQLCLLISRVGLPNSSRYQEPTSVLAVSSLGAPHSSASETLHARHSKVHRSGNPLNRTVFRISRIGCAQLGHRGGFGAELLARSALMTRLGSVRLQARASLARSGERWGADRLNKRDDLSATWLED